jgi:bifunctional DNA-binding transcriptional regulator/antitoxin component of YhaV-PrlF toxin-antitoxin module
MEFEIHFREGGKMLAKLTSKNQITIPKKIVERLPKADYFKVEYRDGAVVLTPLRTSGGELEALREKMRRLGLTEDSVSEAVKWARGK